MKKILQLTVITLNFVFANCVLAEIRAVSMLTSDGIELSAVASGPGSVRALVPAVIFIHQGGSSKEEWSELPLFTQVADAGMLALAFDIRGHGASAGEADFSTLFDSPDQSPRDLEAAIAWLTQTQQVDLQRIAVVGASIGANLAVVAAGTERFSVKTAVALSGKMSAVFNLAGGVDEVSELRSLYAIASELEQDGMRAQWAQEMYAMAAEPHRIDIVAGSSAHGVAVFQDDPELPNRILAWLLKTL